VRLAGRAAAGFVLGALTWLGAMDLGVTAVLGVPVFGAFAIVALLSAAIALTRLRALLWLAAGGVVVGVLLIVYTPLIVAPALSLVRSDSREGRRVDAVVVLSSGVSNDGLIDLQGLERLLSGLVLLRSGAAPALVVTRVEHRDDGVLHSSEGDQRRLIALLSVPVRVAVASPVRSTHDEALRTAAIARREGWRTVAVVTSPLHTHRACAVFERVGLQVVCVPSEERSFALHRLTGGADRLHAFGLWLYETLAWLKYRQLGWV
jgi:uncharacterized SAM-binding protein YcdF (DUF218 family)